MREYKFRLWNKNKKEWDNDDIVIFPDGSLYRCVFGRQIIDEVNYDDYVLMQYTGLKDKNGKDIYEGDIVKYCFDWTYCEPEFGLPTYCEIKIVGIIKITLNGIKVKILNQEHREEGEEELSENIIRSKYINFRKKTKDVEIIGNIYENPELLKEC